MAGGVNMSASEYLSLAQMLLHFLSPTTTRFERWPCHRVVLRTTLRPRQQKSKPLWACNFLVPMAGVEPARSCLRQILSLLRLPISPHRHNFRYLVFLVTKIYYHKKLYLAIILSKFIHLLNGYEHRLIAFVLHQMVHP